MLLGPFRIENLKNAHVNSLAKIADGYGQQWTAELLRTWFGGNQSAWAYGGARDLPQWVAHQLPGLCAGLHATGRTGTVAAQRLLDLALEWISKEIRSGLALSPPSRRDGELGELGKPLAALLTAAAAVGAASTRDVVSGYIRNRTTRWPYWSCPRCARQQNHPAKGRRGTLASVPCPPTARHGSAPGPPARGAYRATGRSNCPRAAHARSVSVTPEN